MNVSASMKISESKTLAELTSHFYAELSIPVMQQLKPEQYKLDDGRVSGYFTAVAVQLKEVINSKMLIELQTKKPADRERLKKLKSDIASYEWLGHVHEIFNNTLMNTKRVIIDKKNIDR